MMIIRIVATIFSIIASCWALTSFAQTGTNKMSSGKNSVVISGSNNQVTIGHIGDVNVNLPGPELRLAEARVSKNPNETYSTEIDAEIVAPYTPGSIRLEAWAPGVISLKMAAQRTGMQMGGHSGVRADHAFTTVMSPFGRYKIFVVTKAQTGIDIRYNFDQ